MFLVSCYHDVRVFSQMLGIYYVQHSRAPFAGCGPIDCAKYNAQKCPEVCRFWPPEGRNINKMRFFYNTLACGAYN